MQNVLTAIIVAGAAALPAAGAAPIPQSSVSTLDLVEACRASRDPLEQDFCLGYILGTSDALTRTGRVCAPINMASGTLQKVTIVRRYIEAHPEKWAVAPSFIVEDALKEAFPCGR